jgi:hypothetical protein
VNIIRTTIATGVLALAATAAYAAEGTFDKSLSVSGAAIVTISTGSGYIHVLPGSDTQVHVIGHVRSNRGWFGADADSKVKEIVANPPIAQTGSIVTIGTQHDDWRLHNISIDYDVTLPKSTTLKATSGSGDVHIANIEGAVTAQSGSGDVKTENIGANAKLGTGSGSIEANGVHGAANAETGSGNIHLQVTAPGDVKVSTGSGSIHVAGVSGALKAGTGSGDVEVQGTPTSEWKLDTGSGSIRLELGTGAKFNLNAETGSGTVHLAQPITMQGDLNKHHIIGSVNGGGTTIKAETGSGNIIIQ